MLDLQRSKVEEEWTTSHMWWLHDLNKACPKMILLYHLHSFMLDITKCHEVLFLYGWVIRCNQVWMAPKDEECTAFCSPKGIYCLK